jgi:AcrR family transcriptional regulator
VQSAAAREPEASHDEGTRERILKSAESLFAERGYPNVTVADIAGACDVSTGLIYYHFEDKLSLFKAIVDDGISTLAAAGHEALSTEGTAAARVVLWLHAYFSTVLEHEGLVRIMTSSRGGDERTGYALAGLAPVFAALADTISDGIESGEFRRTDPVKAAECLVGMAHIRVAARVLGAPHAVADDRKAVWDADEAADFVASLFLDGVRSC